MKCIGLLALVLSGAVGGGGGARALAVQHQAALPPPEEPAQPPRRTRLILNDGSYQMVMSYRVVGQRVLYVSAERAGEQEEVPLSLVNLAATRAWEANHAPPAEGQESRPAPPISPELLKEEADRAALTPEVAPDLRLDPQQNVLALDVFRGKPELVPMLQSSTDLSRNARHSVLKTMINPHSSAHQIVLLKGEASDVQMHVAQPVFYVRTDDAQVGSGTALTVDTHGAAAASDRKRKASPSQYAIVRVEVRQGARVVASFNTGALGTAGQEADVVDSESAALPGGHWMKISPRQPMLFGEYALVEVLGDNQLNLGVWDFGVHPTAPENRDVLLPEKRRREGLGHRPE